MSQFLMQARSSSDGLLYTWTSEAADFAGAGYDGPGDPEEISVVEAGDGVGSSLDFSPVDYWERPNLFTNVAGNRTTAVEFACHAAYTITGIRFHWAGGAASIKVSLWTYFISSRLLATVTASIPGAGTHSILFAAPYVIEADQVGLPLLATVYDSGSGTHYTRATDHAKTYPDFPFFGGPKFVWLNFTWHVTGDAMPNSITGTDLYPIEPILDPP